jgi:uncharacterized membrane protein YbhN (UPF0104 family)
VLVGFLLFNLSLVVRAYRWLLLLRGIGDTIRFQRLVSLYFAANFFNSVLPSGFSGDVVRAVEAAQDVPARTAAGTVLVDRATGLLALFLIGLSALPFRPDNFPNRLALADNGRLPHRSRRWVCAAGRAAGACCGAIGARLFAARVAKGGRGDYGRTGLWLDGRLAGDGHLRPL